MSKADDWLDQCDEVVDDQPVARLGRINAELLSDGTLTLSKDSNSSTHYAGYINLTYTEAQLLLGWLADLYGES